jgi:hypothetical protein
VFVPISGEEKSREPILIAVPLDSNSKLMISSRFDNFLPPTSVYSESITL